MWLDFYFISGNQEAKGQVRCNMTGRGFTGKDKMEPLTKPVTHLATPSSSVLPVVPLTRRNMLPRVALFPLSLTDNLCLQP